MNTQQRILAHGCLRGAESGDMAFPQIVEALSAAGFESYSIDFRRNAACYFLPSGETAEFPTHDTGTAVAPRFNIPALRDAIRDAQDMVPGYTYEGFCHRAKAAGCAGYLVSFPGRRVLYHGRTGETHTEHFPGATPDGDIR